MTLPGVSYVVAIGLLAALGHVGRFRDGDHAASYLGLVLITRQSGNHCYHGRITKAGNSQARWLLTQYCQHVARHPGPLGAFFRRLANRKNRQVAIVAVARKLVTIAFLMLKNNKPFRYAKPKLMAEKFTALERAASGKASKSRKRKPGPTVQARAGLAAVYANAGLPKVTSPDELPDGEQRVLKEQKLNTFVEELYSPTDKQPRKNRNETGRPTGRPLLIFLLPISDRWRLGRCPRPRDFRQAWLRCPKGKKSGPRVDWPLRGLCASAHRRSGYSLFGCVPAEPNSASPDTTMITISPKSSDQPLTRSEVAIRDYGERSKVPIVTTPLSVRRAYL